MVSDLPHGACAHRVVISGGQMSHVAVPVGVSLGRAVSHARAEGVRVEAGADPFEGGALADLPRDFETLK